MSLETTLQPNTSLLNTALEQLPTFVAWKNAQSVYQGCNIHFSNILGLSSPADIIGKTDKELSWDMPCQKAFEKHEKQILKTKLPQLNLNEVIHTPLLSSLEVISNRIPLFDKQGALVGLLIHFSDISTGNIGNQAFFSHILSHLPYYIFWKDIRSVYLGCNDNLARLVGQPDRKNLIGKSGRELNWGDGEAEIFIAADHQVMKGHQQVNQEEVLIRPDGSKIVMLVSKVPVQNKLGETIGLLGISTDITKIKQVEELLASKKRADAANNAKSQFLATMSHELRTPMNAILGLAQILSDANLPPQEKEQVQLILQSGNNLLALIDELLDFGKIEAGKLELVHESFNLHDLAHATPLAIQHILNAKKKATNIDVSVTIDKKLPQWLIGDAQRLRQILLNLASNAAKFTSKGHIKLIVGLAGKKDGHAIIKITVKDTGEGIPADSLPNVFERFYQVGTQYTRKTTGAGLGLAISQQLVVAMGGEIKASSKVGQGSTFWFSIPLKLCKNNLPSELSPSTITKSQHSTAKRPLLGSNILLVEDNLINQKVASLMLEKMGVHLTIVDNGKKALAACKATHYDLVLMDVGLPDIDGLQVTQILRKREAATNTQKTPILAMTAHAGEQDRDNCLSAGMDDVLTKPVNQAVLARTILSWLKKAKAPSHT